MTGLTISTGPSPVSMTTTRRSTPTCEAARPTPSASYIVSNKSSISAASFASKRSMGRQILPRQGSPSVRILRSAIDLDSSFSTILYYTRETGGCKENHGRQKDGVPSLPFACCLRPAAGQGGGRVSRKRPEFRTKTTGGKPLVESNSTGGCAANLACRRMGYGKMARFMP